MRARRPDGDASKNQNDAFHVSPLGPSQSAVNVFEPLLVVTKTKMIQSSLKIVPKLLPALADPVSRSRTALIGFFRNPLVVTEKQYSFFSEACVKIVAQSL